MYASKITYKLINALNIGVWLSGEDLEDDEQLLISFRKFGNKYVPLLGFVNLTDGVDFDSLNEINKVAQLFKVKLESLQLEIPNE